MRAGEPVDNMDLVKFAQLFNDELTLDNLERVHLVNLCRFIGVTPFGTDDFLRVRLRARLSAIKVQCKYTMCHACTSPFSDGAVMCTTPIHLGPGDVDVRR